MGEMTPALRNEIIAAIEGGKKIEAVKLYHSFKPADT